jgi:hypothetical protein
MPVRGGLFPVFVVLCSVLLLSSTIVRYPLHAAPRSGAVASQLAGNDACQPCHATISESYSRTAMARASGVATPTDVSSAEFFHAPSRVRYRLYSENGAAWLSFERAGDRSVRGKRQLLYFIGSGHRGRTYLFAEDGFVFEAPINWYAQKGVWDMAPAFQSARQIPMTFAGTAGVLGLPHQRSGTGLVRARAESRSHHDRSGNQSRRN